MNTAQRKYALERVATITKAKLQALRDELSRPAITITDEQRYELIRSRKVRLKADRTEICVYTKVSEAFDFTGYTRSAGYDAAVYEPRAAAINAEADKVRDRIMLGDAEEAIALLSAFAA